MRIPLLMLVIAGLTGCKRQPASDRSCDQVGTRFVTIARDQLSQQGAKMDAQVRDGVEGLLGPMRDSMVQSCRENHWSAAARVCFADASSQEMFRACESGLSGEQRQALEQSAGRLPPPK